MLRPRPAGWLLAAILCLAVAPATFAQGAWPTKTVRIMVPFAPGALTDVAARAIAQELSQQLPQQFVVENRGGAGGTVGTAEVAKAAPDGHTLVFTDSSYMISAALYSKLAYDPLKDLVPVTLAVEAPAIMVARPGLPARSLRDVVTLAKAKPRTLDLRLRRPGLLRAPCHRAVGGAGRPSSYMSPSRASRRWPRGRR